VNARISPRPVGLVLALGVHFLLAPSVCRANFLLPVGFVSGDPIVSGSNGGLTYNASTGDFKMTLSAPSLDYAAPFVTSPHPGFSLFTGTLTIDLTVDQNGNFVANGTGLTLTGTVTINHATFSGTLLTGTITNFGAQAAGPPSLTFDGYFNITGGLLTQTVTGTSGPVFGGFPLGQSGGFLLDTENVTGGTLGDFTHNFSSSSVKPTVGVLVPEPSSLALFLTGAVVLGGWRCVARRTAARKKVREQPAPNPAP
jgi:hypothetical protein